MELGVHEGTVLFDPFEGVAGVTVHVVVSVRSSAVGKEDHDLVDGLWVLGKVVLEGGFSLWERSLGKEQITQNMSGSFKWD